MISDKTKGRWNFDYYIYLDYSENLVGYIIIEEERIDAILPKITKLHHYRDVKNKSQYLSAIKRFLSLRYPTLASLARSTLGTMFPSMTTQGIYKSCHELRGITLGFETESLIPNWPMQTSGYHTQLGMKRRFERDAIRELLLRWKIRSIRFNLGIFVDVIDFVRKKDCCAIFVSINDNQYYTFLKLFDMVQHQDYLIVLRESYLKRDSVEYRLSLIIDTMLNIERILQKCPKFSKRTLKERNLAVSEAANSKNRRLFGPQRFSTENLQGFANQFIQNSLERRKNE